MVYYIFCIGKENLHIIYKSDWILTGECAKIKTEKMQNVSVFSVPSYNLTGEIVMIKDKKGREVDTMSTMKPIQATPELSGKDAERLLNQADIAPTEKAMNKNNMLRGVLNNIRKA